MFHKISLQTNKATSSFENNHAYFLNSLKMYFDLLLYLLSMFQSYHILLSVMHGHTSIFCDVKRAPEEYI